MKATHTIERYGKHFVPGESWLTERLAPALSALEQGLDSYQNHVREAARSGRQLRDEFRARKQAEIKNKGRKEFQKLRDAALEELKASQSQAKESLRLKTAPSDFDSSIEKLAYQLRAQEIRQELKSMEPVERARLLNDAAVNGNREFIDAAKGAVAPLVNAEILQGAEQRFERSVAGPEMDQVELENYVIQKAESIARLAERQLDMIEQYEGGDDLLDPPDARPDLSEWTAKDKSDFIRQHGHKSWVEYSQGHRPLEDFQPEEEEA